MYTIISGTNRSGSNTLKVAKAYQRVFESKGIDAGLFSLEGVNVLKRDADFEKIEQDVIIPTSNFIFISPEYNGSFPGVLKMLFDTGKSHHLWWHKKAMITGVSTGRAGNLRGMDHLSAVLNYLKVTVFPNQLPISLVDKLMDSDGNFTDQLTIEVIDQQVEGFIKWSEGRH